MFRYLSALSPKGIPAYMLFTVPVLSSMPALGQIASESDLTSAISAANTSGDDTTFSITADISLSSNLDPFNFNASFTSTSAQSITGGDLSVINGNTLAFGDNLTFGGDISLAGTGTSLTIGSETDLASSGTVDGNSIAGLIYSSDENRTIDSSFWSTYTNFTSLTKEGEGTLTIDDISGITNSTITANNGTLVIDTSNDNTLEVSGDANLQINADQNRDVNFDSTGNLTVDSGSTIDGYVRIYQSGADSSIAGTINENMSVGGTSTLEFSGTIIGTTTVYGESTLTTSGTPTLTGDFSANDSSTITIESGTTLGRRLDVNDSSNVTLNGTVTVGDRTVIGDESQLTSNGSTTFQDNVLIKDRASASFALGTTVNGDLTLRDSANVTSFSGNVTGDVRVASQASLTTTTTTNFAGDLTASQNSTLNIGSSTTVEGDTRINTQNTVTFNGTANGEFIADAGDIEFGGDANGRTTISTSNFEATSGSSLTYVNIAAPTAAAAFRNGSTIENNLGVGSTSFVRLEGTLTGDLTAYNTATVGVLTGSLISGDVLISDSANLIYAFIDTGSETSPTTPPAIGGALNLEGTLDLSRTSHTLDLTINDDLTINEDAQVIIGVSMDTTSGELTSNKINIADNTTINGGTLIINPDDNFDANQIDPSSSLEITVLESETSLTGSFDNISGFDDELFLNATATTNQNDIEINVNRLSFTTIANTNNQRQVGNALESATISDNASNTIITIEEDLLAATDANIARETLDQLSGAAFATTVSAQLDLAKRQQAAISQQLSPYTSIRQKLVWKNQKRVAEPKRLSGNWAHIGDGSIGLLANYTFNSGEFGSGISGVDYDGTTFSVGLSKRFNDEWLVGGVVGFGEYDFDFSGSQTGRTKSDTIDTNLFAQYRMGSWYFNGVAGLTFFDSESDRIVVTPQLSLSPAADQESTAYSALIEAGHIFEFKSTDTPGLQENPLNVQPYASAQYSTIGYDSWSETGAGTAGLDIDSGDHNSLELGLGVRVSQRFPITATQSLRAQGRLGLVHDTADTQAEIDASFVNTTQSNMTLEGSDIDDTRVEAGLGVAYDIGRSFTVNVDAQASFGSDRDTVSVRGGFGWTF